jgi:peptidoglycan/LPS O-acetylase OafA/YrhL
VEKVGSLHPGGEPLREAPPSGGDPSGGAVREARYGALDGVRALGISLVLLTHLSGTAGFGLRVARVTEGLGPSILFLVSGFLITTVLRREHARTGRVAIAAFYVRRAVRILPALYVFAGAVLLLEAAGVLSLRPGDAVAALTQTMNFHADRAWWLGHLWSISLQEQFYFLWPLALAAAGFGRGLVLSVAGMVAAPLLRTAVFIGWPSLRPLVDQAFPLVLDGVATGCALAFARDRLWERAWYRRLLSSRWFALVPAGVVALHLPVHRVAYELLIGPAVTYLGLALCLDWTLRFRDGAVGAVLRSRPAVWLSTISYSLYVWQQLFLCRAHPAWFTRFPLNLLLAFGAAVLSHHLVERPMLRLRPHAWLARPAPGHAAPRGLGEDAEARASTRRAG